jgi:hypothetical protein
LARAVFFDEPLDGERRLAAVQCFRRGNEARPPIGTVVGACVTAVLSAAFLVLLVSIGTGPV